MLKDETSERRLGGVLKKRGWRAKHETTAHAKTTLMTGFSLSFDFGKSRIPKPRSPSFGLQIAQA
jgi:hypothetical protein